jgi:acyl-CoA synthetase (AMP-forming)/AMP-acid ligase II
MINNAQAHTVFVDAAKYEWLSALPQPNKVRLILLGGEPIDTDRQIQFDVQQYLTLAQRYRVTHTMLVPVQYQRLVALPNLIHLICRHFK